MNIVAPPSASQDENTQSYLSQIGYAGRHRRIYQQPQPGRCDPPCPNAIQVGGQGAPRSRTTARVKPPRAASPKQLQPFALLSPLQFIGYKNKRTLMRTKEEQYLFVQN